MRAIVVDVEPAEQLRAVEQGSGTDGVEALLDDRRPHALGARVVAIVDREQRPAGRDGLALERSVREVADAGQEARGQAATDLGDGG